MRCLILTISALCAAPPCEAGYTEYQLLAESSCEAFSITTDAVAPAANAPGASAEYKAYVANTRRSTTDFWALEGPEAPTRWADCQESESEIACTVIGTFKFQSFRCKLGQSKEWSRSCRTGSGAAGELKIYSVDTNEYELGGEPIANRYFRADLSKFDARCKTRAGKRP